MDTYRQHFLSYLQIRGYAEDTIEKRDVAIRRFIHWCVQRDIVDVTSITRPILEAYQRSLFHFRKANGDAMSLTTQGAHIAALRVFFKWLARQNHIRFNPAAELDSPKRPQKLPRGILSETEVQALLQEPDLESPSGVRDRAILETLYSSGLRRQELAPLKRHDVDLNAGTVFVRRGKGGYERLVPVGSTSLQWIERYLHDVRPLLVRGADEHYLFLTDYGEPFIKTRLSFLVKKYLKKAGIEKEGATHLLRHAMATHMLDNGADVRVIQELLGHQQISTTQIYTKVAIRKLMEVHRSTHPSNLTSSRRQDEDS